LCGGVIVKVVRVERMGLLLAGWFGRCQFRDVADKPLVTTRESVSRARKDSELARQAVSSATVAVTTQ
jgi:hypothetical protein